jgi:hypothetical protein
MLAWNTRWIGGGVAILCTAAQLLAAALFLSTERGWDYASVMLLGFPLVGALIISRQPRNTIGWILVVSGASTAFGLLSAAIIYATLTPDPALWQRLLAWVTNIVFIGSFEGLLLALAYLFPTGRSLSPRWRVAGLVVGLLLVMNFVVVAIRPGPLAGFFDDTPALTNPFGVPGVDTFLDRIGSLLPVLGFAVILTSLAAVITRVRRARGLERLQLQWLGLALGLVGVSLLLSVVTGALLPKGSGWVATVIDDVFFGAGTLGVSAAIGIAILRYRLYDIERIINRALVYLTLSVGLALGYAGLVVLLQSIVGPLTHGSDLTVAGATLGVVTAVRPVHRRIQAVVDRRFARRRYDAERTIADFSARLREQIDLDTLMTDLQGVVHQTMQPTQVSVWVRPTAVRSASEHRPPPSAP